MNVVKKIIYGETKEDGSRSFHIVTRGGVCYGRLYDGEWAYVHYNAHQSGIDYMTDMPKRRNDDEDVRENPRDSERKGNDAEGFS